MGTIRQKLTQKIIEKSNEGYTQFQISDGQFPFLPGNEELNELYSKRENPETDKWMQLVRYIFFDKDQKEYLSKRIMRLLVKNKDSIEDYFKISDDTGNYILPDRFSDYLRLRTLYRKYFEIYQKIMHRINFDYPAKRFSEPRIQGKIDWSRTVKNSPFKFPLKFETKSWVREFQTPENTLLLLCAYWIKQDIASIYNQNFSDPLSIEEKEIMNNIDTALANLITVFPFPEVKKLAKDYSFFLRNSMKVIQLKLDVKTRLKDGTIRNINYMKLLDWIEEYTELNLFGNFNLQNRFAIKNLEDVDTMYEILIFLEFLDYVKNKKHIQAKLEVYNKKRYKYKIILPIEDKIIDFYHDREFHKHGWALPHRPDFSAMIDNKILCVFDAKNYGKNEKVEQEHHNKLTIWQGYVKMNRLTQEKLDMFIQKWPLLDKEKLETFCKIKEKSSEDSIKFMNDLIDSAKSDLDEVKKERDMQKKDESGRRNEAKNKMLSYITNLDLDYGCLIFPKFEKNSQKYPDSPTDKPRFHHDLKLEHLRLDYVDNEDSRKERDYTLETIYNTIIERINT
jgi:hypothetical protein